MSATVVKFYKGVVYNAAQENFCATGKMSRFRSEKAAGNTFRF
jgi:hypothetical protein